MSKFDNILDNDYMKIQEFTFRSFIFIFILLILLIFSVLFIHKERFYTNAISFINEDMACIVVSDEVLEIIKQRKELLINDISYDFNIEKIEKKRNMYFVYAKFSFKISGLDDNNYKIFLGKESLMKYIIRKLRKGES